MEAETDMTGDASTALFKNGDMFNGLVVDRLLGKGGGGEVYLVRHEMLDNFFALKVLDPKVAVAKPEYVKRFLREAKLASKIRHPNLVAVHDAGIDKPTGLYYLVMDYVQGSTLREAIAFGGAMDEKEAVRIVLNVASALAAAQHFGVVHRDIKPENIMLMPDNSVKLIDLGVAKVTSGIDTLKTMENTIFGTPAYMAPEQAVDASSVDARADIYSLGVILFEMLCGRSPYQGQDASEIIHELLSPNQIPDVRTFNPEVSVKLSAVISLMCAKQVEERLASPSAVIDTFSRLGYRVPAAVAEYDDTSIHDEPIPQCTATAGKLNNTLTFESKDAEVRAFVAKLKRRRLLKRIVLLLLTVLAVAGAVLLCIN